MKTALRVGAILLIAIICSVAIWGRGFLKNTIEKASKVFKTEQLETKQETSESVVSNTKQLITESGVGIFNFNNITVGKMGDYIVEEFDDDEFGRIIFIKNSKEELAITYYPGQLMTVHSPDFQTESGISAGTTLEEARQKINNWNPTITNYDVYRAYLLIYSPKIAFAIGASDLKDGGAAFDEAYSKGTYYTPKLSDFKPEAEIYEIVITK